MEHGVGGCLGAGKDFGFVDGFDDSALHQDFAVDDYGVDVLAPCEVGDTVHRHVERIEVGLVHVKEDKVGLLADLQGADFRVHAQGSGPVYGAHLQGLAGRYVGALAELRPVLSHAGIHVAEHVVVHVRGGGV